MAGHGPHGLNQCQARSADCIWQTHAPGAHVWLQARHTSKLGTVSFLTGRDWRIPSSGRQANTSVRSPGLMHYYAHFDTMAIDSDCAIPLAAGMGRRHSSSGATPATTTTPGTWWAAMWTWGIATWRQQPGVKLRRSWDPARTMRLLALFLPRASLAHKALPYPLTFALYLQWVQLTRHCSH